MYDNLPFRNPFKRFREIKDARFDGIFMNSL